ncbi:MAG: hypothetical protein Q7R84_00005 [bacterium]|nr:hypothetical protein [bacterium]
MPDDIEFQNIKKQYPEFFKEFSDKLMELISSDETASKISDICLKNGVKNDETVEGVSYHIISVLLGALRQELLSNALVLNLKIDALVAKKIYEEANRLIFSLASSLETQKPAPTPEPPLPPIEKPEKPAKEEPPRPRGKDVYHEPIV